MAIVVKPQIGNGVFDSTTINVALPTGGANFVALGDRLISLFSFADPQTGTDPAAASYASFTAPGGFNSDNSEFAFQKTAADSTDVSVSAAAGTIPWSCLDGFIWCDSFLAISGLNAVTPYAAGPVNASVSSTTFTGTITNPTAGLILLMFVLIENNSGAVLTDPAGMTKIADATSPFSDIRAIVYQETTTASGSLTRSGTITNGFMWGTTMVILNPASGGGSTYTLTAAQGAYAWTGEAMAPKFGRKLSAAQGAYVMTGEAMAPKFGRKLTAVFGAYVFTGKSVAFVHGYRLPAAQGAYVVTGEPVGLRAARKLSAAQGAYAWTGAAAGLLKGHTLTASFGSYAFTGQAANLLAARKLSAAQGSYTVTGQAAGFVHGYRIIAAQGAYAWTGEAANLIHGYRLSAAQGAYVWTGQAAALKLGRRLTAVQGSYALTGEPAGLQFGRRLAAAQGAYAVTGEAAGLRAGRRLTAVPGAYTWTGQAAALTYNQVRAYVLGAATGMYAFTGEPIGLVWTRLHAGGFAHATFTEQSAVSEYLVQSATAGYLTDQS